MKSSTTASAAAAVPSAVTEPVVREATLILAPGCFLILVMAAALIIHFLVQ